MGGAQHFQNFTNGTYEGTWPINIKNKHRHENLYQRTVCIYTYIYIDMEMREYVR